MLLVFLIILGVAHGEEVGLNVPFNSTSGHFSVDEGSFTPNTTWTADIEPVNATEIFVVIEEMILDSSDSLSIINVHNETLNEINGTHDPFSFLSEGPNVTLVLKLSSKQVKRKFTGYYTETGCIYQVNRTSGILATPQFYIRNNMVTCNFSFPQQSETGSKYSVTFLQFDMKKSQLLVVDSNLTFSYSGNSIPPEIISKKQLELNFTLHKNDSAKLEYDSILEESEYVVLSKNQQSHKFDYMPSPEKAYYPPGQDCHWVIESEKSTTISFQFSQVSLSSGITRIIIIDGNNSLSKSLFQVSSTNEKAITSRYFSSSGNYLWISIQQPDRNTLVLGEATMHTNGGYRTGNGTLSVPSNSTEVVYLIEEEEGENAVLSQHNGTLNSNSTIFVYSDFSTDSLLIAVYNTSLPQYPIVSSTSKMMVIATSFGENAMYKANYGGFKEGCYKMSTADNGEYQLAGNCNATCKWIVPPVKATDKVISLHLHPVAVEKGDVITLSLLDASQTPVANVTSLQELPEFYLPSSSGFVLTTVRGNCSASNMLHATFDREKDCSVIQELTSGTNLSVKSPNFPDTYPFWAHCWANVTSTNTTKNGHFLLTFNKIDLATEHCIRIRSKVGNSSQVVQTYEGTMPTLPADLILNSAASVEFLAKPCNRTKKELPNPTTSSGFHLDILSADCGGKLAKEEGNFSIPDLSKNASASMCIWIVEVPEEKNIINFTLSRSSTKNYELKIYDGPSLRNETMKNLSDSTLLSRTNSLIFVYRQNSSLKATQGIQVTFHSQACTTSCENGLCLHDDWKCNSINDCGDNTDEIGCHEVPINPTVAPTPPSKSSGVSPVALGLGIPIAFILGILATIYLPPLIRRFRSGQYHQFRDTGYVSADA